MYHNIVDILSVDSAEFWRYKNANICYSESSSAAAKEAQLKTSGFLVAVVDILLDYVRKENDRSCKVVDFHHPHALKEMMSHCLNITDEPQNLEQILSDCKETLKYCVKTGFYHRYFLNLYGISDHQCPFSNALSSFIHSGYFYSASSSPLLLRGSFDYRIDRPTVSELTRRSTTYNCE